MWAAQEIRALRTRLALSQAAFARLTGVDVRTVIRWEAAGGPRPTGAAEAVLTGIREKLDEDPRGADRIIQFLAGAAAVGGLAYVMVKLLGSVSGRKGSDPT